MRTQETQALQVYDVSKIWSINYSDKVRIEHRRRRCSLNYVWMLRAALVFSCQQAITFNISRPEHFKMWRANFMTETQHSIAQQPEINTGLLLFFFFNKQKGIFERALEWYHSLAICSMFNPTFSCRIQWSYYLVCCVHGTKRSDHVGWFFVLYEANRAYFHSSFSLFVSRIMQKLIKLIGMKLAWADWGDQELHLVRLHLFVALFEECE